jgi:hypothetical protein
MLSKGTSKQEANSVPVRKKKASKRYERKAKKNKQTIRTSNMIDKFSKFFSQHR